MLFELFTRTPGNEKVKTLLKIKYSMDSGERTVSILISRFKENVGIVAL